MEGYSEAVRFIADQLDQVKHRRMVIEGDRFIFLSRNINDFLTLGDGGQRLIDNFE